MGELSWANTASRVWRAVRQSRLPRFSPPNLDLPQELVRVRVSEYSSRQLFLFGPIAGKQQSFPYRGQETVLDFLQRGGVLATDKQPAEVYVVRAHIAEDGRPEVFHIDLKVMADRHDQKTNLRLLPNDQIYLK